MMATTETLTDLPMEHAFIAKKTLPSGGEASSCVVMQHMHTKRSRKLYVFKTITKDQSLISHPEHGIISNEAYILLGKLKTNLYPHPNIIQLFNCVSSNAVTGIPIHILQMEYCDGGDLWNLNNRCISHGTRFPNHWLVISSPRHLRLWHIYTMASFSPLLNPFAASTFLIHELNGSQSCTTTSSRRTFCSAGL